MGLDCGGNRGTYILFASNLIHLLIGLAILILGVVTRVDNEDLFTDEVRATLNYVSLSNDVSLGTLVNVLNIIYICDGALIVLVAGFGFIGTCCKAKPLLIVYIVMLIATLMLQMVCVSLSVFMRFKVQKTLDNELYDALTNYEGVSSTDKASTGLDMIFIKCECCGTADITSTNNGNHFSHTKYWSTKPAADKVPASCCKGATKKSYKTYTNTACTKDLTDNWQQNCNDKLRDELIEKYLLPSIVLAVIVLVIEIVVLICFCIVCKNFIGKDNAETVNMEMDKMKAETVKLNNVKEDTEVADNNELAVNFPIQFYFGYRINVKANFSKRNIELSLI